MRIAHDKPVHRKAGKVCRYKLHLLRMLRAGKAMEPVQPAYDKPVHRKARKACGYKLHQLRVLRAGKVLEPVQC
jgi:hypothetical protein